MWQSRRARQQIKEDALPSGVPPQTGLTFNIWYNKWSQGNSRSGNDRFVSPFRVDVRRDSGTTSAPQDAHFCLYFARGCCILGSKCSYMHHIPDEKDAEGALKKDTLDCFGREKFSEYRDDMGGVGSFMKHNKTLYVGGITSALNNKNLKPTQIESRIRFMFRRLGSIERIRYIEAKNCAFVKYKNQVNAEFARESMMNQTLLLPNDKEWEDRIEGSGLLVKWANDDPDPEAQRQNEKTEKLEMLNILKKLVNDHDELERTVPTDESDKTSLPMTQFMKQATQRMKQRGIDTSQPFLKKRRITAKELTQADNRS